MPTVFLTGASTGIGLETAKLLTQKGYAVWGSSRNIERLPKLPSFHPIKLDLNDPESIESAFKQVIQETGKLDILINNAGSGYFGTFEQTPQNVWREQMQTLLHGPLQLTRLALAHMREQKSGTILNISSLAVRFPIPFMASYNAAKAAFSSATRSLRLEMSKGIPIHIIDLQPGDICTPFHDAMNYQFDNQKPPTLYQYRMQLAYKVIEHNMRCASHPRSVAQKILSILKKSSPASAYKVGGFFQTQLAPLGQRFFPASWIEAALRSYYKLG